MGLREDLDRFREVGERNRQDLSEFIQYGDLGGSRNDEIQIPIKIVDLPSFEYDQLDQGGVGQGDGDAPDQGDPVGRPQPQPGDGDEGEPGEDSGDHEYYEMDPEEFARELDEELGLDLEPKGKKVVEEVEGEYTDITRTGPNSTLDFERLFKEGLKRKLAMDFDEEFVREVLKVDGVGPDAAYEWARGENLPVSKAWLEDARREGIDRVPFRREDERYRYPETVEEYERNVVVVNIRDVSGSMREKKRELVERTFTPLDWYLTGKYDNAEFVYVAHDAEAWEVERDEFFGIRSGGGTRISSAYELTAEILDERYPWSEWNRYVFAAGDSENSSNDTEDRVIPMMSEMPANLHAYVETQPSGNAINATHAEQVEAAFSDSDDVVVSYVSSKADVTDAIYEILSTEES
ncbi:hypothetical protein BRC81_16765 [Halobacteriales archaeon QS_1_68_20]|nr:MAG: hypothetical protein BRC81_16765 [Halobacteriales archaeon QS_1_68_20]